MITFCYLTNADQWLWCPLCIFLYFCCWRCQMSFYAHSLYVLVIVVVEPKLCIITSKPKHTSVESLTALRFFFLVVRNILGLEEGKECILVGTVFKDMKLKPCILDEYAKEVRRLIWNAILFCSRDVAYSKLILSFSSFLISFFLQQIEVCDSCCQAAQFYASWWSPDPRGWKWKSEAGGSYTFSICLCDRYIVFILTFPGAVKI